jgi:benzil reductase ((S)-benzoin forming)
MSWLVIVTGASRGLGAALARHTAGPTTTQLLSARSQDELEAVVSECRGRGASVQGVVADLSHAEGFARIERALQSIDLSKLSRALLINNASQVTPIKPIFELHEAEVQQAVQLNFLSPLCLTAAFLRQLYAMPHVQGEVLNISSGVSLNPLTGWAVYCATKAAVNMTTRLVSEETRGWSKPVRAVAINPGPLDTEMQAVIRGAAESDFPEVERFRALHRERRLIDPAIAARRALDLFAQNPFPHGQFVDLKDG